MTRKPLWIFQRAFWATHFFLAGVTFWKAAKRPGVVLAMVMPRRAFFITPLYDTIACSDLHLMHAHVWTCVISLIHILLVIRELFSCTGIHFFIYTTYGSVCLPSIEKIVLSMHVATMFRLLLRGYSGKLEPGLVTFPRYQ